MKTRRRSGTRRTASVESYLVYGGSSRSSLLGRVHADEAPVAAFVFEFHDAGNQRKQGVVFALPHIHARLMLGPTLADQNRSRVDTLPAEPLDAQPLSM